MAARKPAPKAKAPSFEPLDIARAAVALTAGSSASAILSVGDTIEGRLYLDDPGLAPGAAIELAAEHGGYPVVAIVAYPVVRIETFAPAPNPGVEDVALPAGH